jgi:hypothetical protein
VAHGGPRKGAGRKAGSTTRKTREIAERATAEGITPLEVMLRAMREHVEHADTLQAQAAKADDDVLLGEADDDLPVKLRRAALTAITEAATMAKDAAPYMHPRLANVNANIEGDLRATVKIVSEFPDE